MSSSIWVFPGQGSQQKGMGEALFARFPEQVKAADAVLGYSIRELCLEDPQGVLGETAFTQPALFVVSALGVLAEREDGVAAPDCYAGHSLGEFAALFAAGAFDFATGVALVKERGRLMSTVSRGAMAAVVGMSQTRVAEVLAESALTGVDIANINTAQQIVISGLADDIAACEARFTAAGARFVKLNVSAAFHSRYMREIGQQFAQFAQQFTFNPLQARVISNYTALDYPPIDYLDLLTSQISQPVRWYESLSRLLAQGEVTQREIGPGQVLTNLFTKIQAQPMTLSATPKGEQDPQARVVFMYGGQGSQYHGMGADLYQRNSAFRKQMDACHAIYQKLTGNSLLEPLYDETRRHLPLTDIVLSNAALLSVGVSLTQMLGAQGIVPSAVVGYSLGECISAVVAGVLTLDDAMKLVVTQGRLLGEKNAGGGMMSVLAPVAHFQGDAQLYQHTELASINFPNNFVVSGALNHLNALKEQLSKQEIISMVLPVEHPFHSSGIAPIEQDFRVLVDTLPKRPATIPVYSAMSGARVAQWDNEYFWRVLREKVDFYGLMQKLTDDNDTFFVDLSPTGTLSTFLKYGFSTLTQQGTAINQFGRNVESVSHLQEKIRKFVENPVMEGA